MRAALPMYDQPAPRAQTDAWWRGLARAFEAEGIAQIPAALERGAPPGTLWAADDLLLSQTCGYPLMYEFRDRLTVVATPCYDTPDADGPNYRSLIVVADDTPYGDLGELKGGRAAINGYDSHSGMNALRHAVARHASQGGFFVETLRSGSHGNSIAMVARGEADVAAIDCVTHALLQRHRPEALAGTRVLGRTESAPGLPYVTHGDAGVELLEALRKGLRRALRDRELAPARAELLIEDFEILPLGAYERMVEMEAEATRLGHHLPLMTKSV